MATFHDVLHNLYLQGGRLALYASPVEYSARSLLERATIHKSLPQAKSLARLIERHYAAPHSEETFDLGHDLMMLTRDFFVPLVDDVVLIAAFEAAAKAKLLRQRYVVHQIAEPRDLAQTQKVQPIHVLTVQARHRANQVVRFSPNTIGMSALLKPRYRTHYPMSAAALAGLNAVHTRRNLIHFNLGYTWNFSHDFISFVEHLERFIPAKK